ncbi:hypothetical protein VST63_26690 [Mycolicibacterium sp. 050232]|uniref:hypothetical protein n=1 Tax=Mycolicibacterium sp. 050232 TaxID=3113982 RepID=UPI002E27E3BD|nr:hypothetical protein [Mycolicibacterium sp. 050232]MED5815961.1 hypothetical protein [Mycolicibacterium sp. 050232]
MRSSEHPDIPQGWANTHDDVRFWLSVVGLSAIAFFSTMFGIVGIAGGYFVALKYFLLFALLMVLVIALGLVSRYRRVDVSTAIRTVESNGLPGTEIRYSAWQFTILVALMGCFALFCTMASVEIFIYQDEGFPGAAVVTGALGILFLSFLVAVAAGRVRRGGFTLSSQGIFQRGRSFESRLDWSDIASVRAVAHRYPIILAFGYANADWNRRYTTPRFCRIEFLPLDPMIELDCRQFDVDPYILYSYVRTYVDNPELRAELGTEAALARARYMQPGR